MENNMKIKNQSNTSNIKLMDLHTDILTAQLSDETIINSIKNYNKAGYKPINAIYQGDLNFSDAVKRAEFAKNNNICQIAFENCCYEDYLLKDGCEENAINQNIKSMAKEIVKTQPLYVSLTWNHCNLFAGGAKERGCLSTYGGAFLDIMNREKIPIDLSHLNIESFYNVVERGEKVLCTHTAISDVKSHCRNISKDMIKKILSKNGIVGLTFVGYFLAHDGQGENYYESAFKRHIACYLDNFGTDGLAIGSDFYGSDLLAFENGNYKDMYEKLNDWFDEIGLNSEEKQKIFYKNAVDFFNL